MLHYSPGLSIANIGHLSPLGGRWLTARHQSHHQSRSQTSPGQPRATQLVLWYTTCRNLIKITNISFVIVLFEQVFCVSKYFQFDVKPWVKLNQQNMDLQKRLILQTIVGNTPLLTVYKWNCIPKYYFWLFLSILDYLLTVIWRLLDIKTIN